MKRNVGAACLLLMALGAASCSAAVVTVDCGGGGDFTAIQEAVAAAANGDTIHVMPCVYTEQVTLLNRELTLVGSGFENTIVYWDGPEATLELDFLESATPLRPRSGCAMTGFTIEHADNGYVWSGPAIEVRNTVLELTDCRIVRGALVASDPEDWFADADILATRCEFDFLRIAGQAHEASSVEDCRIGSLRTSGGHDWTGSSTDALVFTTRNAIGDLEMLGGTVLSQQDSISVVTVVEAVNSHSVFLASDGAFGILDGWTGGGRVEIVGSTLDSLTYVASYTCSLRLHQSLVHRGVTVYGFADRIEITHNTFLAPVHLVIGGGWANSYILSNIFVEELTGEAAAEAEFSNNDFVAGSSVVGGTFATNISEDPLFCDPEMGDYGLHDCSPCVGAAHDGGDIGAYGVACECFVPTERKSWGAIKGLFR